MSEKCDKKCYTMFHMSGGFHRTDCAAYPAQNLADLTNVLINLVEKNTTMQARVNALEKLLDPETLARKIGDWDFAHNDDYFCFKFGGDGDNGEMLIDALAALLQETDQ